MNSNQILSMAKRLAAACAILILCCSASAQLAASAWPKFGADLGNTHQGKGKGAVGKIKWTYNTLGGAFGPTVFGTDGSIYFLTVGGKIVAETPSHAIKWFAQVGLGAYGLALGPEGALYVKVDNQIACYSSSGVKQWITAFNGSVLTPPMVGADGTIFVIEFPYTGTSDDLVALNPDATVKWSFPFPRPAITFSPKNPVIGSDGTLYLATAKNVIAAVSAAGTEKWTKSLSKWGDGGGSITSGLALGPADALYFHGVFNLAATTPFNGVAALNSDGSVKWLAKTLAGEDPGITPTVNSTGTVFMTAFGEMYTLHPNGGMGWTVQGIVTGNPALGADGTVYVIIGSGIQAFTPNGTARWALPYGQALFLSLSPTGNLYFVDDSTNTLYEASSAGKEIWSENTGGVFGPPVIGPDGTLYSCCSDSTVDAFTPEGVLKWRSAAPGVVQSSPAVGKDGTIYAVGDSLYAFTPSGIAKWTLSDQLFTGSEGPTIGSNGDLYIQGLYALYAVNPSGTRLWGLEGNFGSGPPALAGDMIYVVNGFNLLALNASTGTQIWSSIVNGGGQSVAVCPNGSILASGLSNVSSLTSAGQANWSTPLFTGGNVAVAANGTIYTAQSFPQGLTAFNSSGSQIWNQSAFSIFGDISIGGDGTLYFCTYDGLLNAVSTASGEKIWQLYLPGVAKAPAIGADGTLYVAGSDGSIRAIQ